MLLFRNRKRILYLAAALLSVIALLIAMACWESGHSDFESDSEWELAEFVEHDGALYRLRDDVDTFLIMGVDQFSGVLTDESYNNDQCADFLLLLVIDHAAKECSAIQINRDTMAEVSVLGVGGKKTGTLTQQITLSHTYGTGGSDSCRNTARAVSGLLGNLTIDHYACLTMDAVAALNDLVGGVTVTVEDDLTAIDPAFVQGTTLTLKGDQALRYVRHRSELADSSNASRMKRQEQYLNALYPAVLDYVAQNQSFPTDAVTTLSRYTTTDFSATELERTIETLSTYRYGSIYRPDGTYQVDTHVEFVPDMADLQNIVIDLFYEKK